MKKLYIFLMLTTLFFPVYASQRVNVSKELSIELPDGMRQTQASETGCIFSADDGDCFLKVYSIVKSNVKWNLRAIDGEFFPGLSLDSLKKSKEEYFFQLGKDYIKRYYEQNGWEIVTFSSHTKNALYVFLFQSRDKSHADKFDEMLKSIEYKRSFFENAHFVYNCGRTPWTILLIIVSLFSLLVHLFINDMDLGFRMFIILIVTLVEGLLLVFPLWGNLSAIIAGTLVCFVLNIIGGLLGVVITEDN